MLSKLTVLALGALTLVANDATFGVHAAPTAACPTGKYKVNGVCKTISPCILTGGLVGGVLNALGVKINSNNVLNLDSNTCSTAASCTAGGGTISKTTVAGIAGIPLCKTKPSTGPAKSCGSSLVLDPKLNICTCLTGLIFADSKKQSCIKPSSCKSPNKVVNGVCTKPSGSSPAKKCPTDKVLDIDTGLCICGSNKVVDEVSGLCIDKKSCNTQLSTIISGVCTRKRCEADLHLNKVGVCVCPAGEVLRAQGSNLCVSVNLCATVLNGVCKVLKDSGVAGGLGLGSIIHS